MQLTTLQYDAIMQCINHGKALIADDDFIDPYQPQEGQTNETLLKALHEVEMQIIKDNTPR